MNSDKGCSRDSVSSESPDDDISYIINNNDSSDDDDDDDDDDDGGGGGVMLVPNIRRLLSFSLSRSAMLLIYG